MQRFSLKCPGCAKTLSFGPKMLGTTFACPNCKTAVNVPANLVPAPPKKAEQAPLAAASVAAAPLAVASGAIPIFKAPDKEGDSIFDAEAPAGLFDAPKPIPSLPPEPLPQGDFQAAEASNPFEFMAAEATVPAKPAEVPTSAAEMETLTEENPFAIPAVVPTPRALPAAKRKESPKPATAKPTGSKASIGEISNATAEIAVVPLLKPESAPAPEDEDGTFPDEDEKRPAKAKKPAAPTNASFPIITWIFLAWAVVATGAAVYFAMQSPPGKPTTTGEKNAPPKDTKTETTDKTKNSKTAK
jgi:hypothetical protein